MGGVLGEIAGWFARVGDELGRVSPGALLAAVALQTLIAGLNALAWRNILRAAYPAGGVRYPPVFGVYAGGDALNHVLPAQAGTVAMLGLLRGMVPGSTVPGLLGAQVVQTLFYGAAGAAVYAFLFTTFPGASEVHFSALLDRPALAAALALAAAAAGLVVARLLRRRLRRALADAREGAAILRSPRRYAAGVLLPQLAAWTTRLALVAVLMRAYGVPVSPRTVFLVVAVMSVSTLVAVTPGGVGTQQALAAVVLADVAPTATVAAYSLGQQAILTAWNVALGAVALAATIGWGGTRGLIREQWALARGRGPADR
ncbi:lysylphosphatidylglycerol synthase domain-containing protein [Miltoncostaea marina]|uniref:lysylphosphatidylglycerol synthase domain-containing protein n=1 Tax=Miltoncostaea marina TaxID=2843215 RepID=UPI001C3CFB1A|nr:lysylphosphatidylglycerol synthase domain-containing protein [Miltoncostaea marina]